MCSGFILVISCYKRDEKSGLTVETFLRSGGWVYGWELSELGRHNMVLFMKSVTWCRW